MYSYYTLILASRQIDPIGTFLGEFRQTLSDCHDKSMKEMCEMFKLDGGSPTVSIQNEVIPIMGPGGIVEHISTGRVMSVDFVMPDLDRNE